MKIAREMLLRVSIFRCNARCNKLKFVFKQKQPLRGALESRLLILVHLFVANKPYEHIISNSKASEIAEASTSTVSIYPGQDCDITRQKYEPVF